MLIAIIVFAAIIVLGILLIAYGPVGWRTHILGAVVAVFPAAGEVLNALGAFDWSKLISDSKIVAAAGLGVGLLIIIYNSINKSLYGSTPKV